ncbi:ORF6N domain-containing protein [Paenibacillus naphthalenovorans]|uniref:ORF6N domain-containing protein n=1 Tax=Paenibacillus naphthalenovorans TaxID=162209 RepID=UPI0008868A0B|nr:ORF6N domain-containing protein [Paenibacillus naphthalenovorans]GCL71754.1 hypothetical protein PN4B1_16590 [Paenibacillus naphthalenovorans]SDJ62221.1 ORF6N domain-containing protein [Paenibacillus naphthalenovorans]
MNQLKVIEQKGIRVLTSAQLAEVFGTDFKRINYNFNYNKERYEEGKHFFVLTGDQRREFINEHEIHASLKTAHTIYLWTEKGAFLHAKSLNTDQAWDAYSKLVDDYYKKVEESKQSQPDLSALSPQLQFMIMMEQKQKALETKQAQLEERINDVEEVKTTVNNIAEYITAVPDHAKVVSTVNEFARWTRLGHNEVYNKVYEILKRIHGIDVRQRVENERERIQKEYNRKSGKWYSESTLKSKVNGIDIMVRMGCLDKFNNILVGLLSQEKIKTTLRRVK